MHLDQLDLRDLLEYSPTGGVVRFAGQRALILDAVALGLLRKELIHTIGAAAARGVLTRFGYAHGWRTARTMEREFPWDSASDWRRAGGRLHRLQGVVLFEPVDRDGAHGHEHEHAHGRGRPFAEALWNESYEAEQHLLHLGRADEPVCWTLVGFASGYLSYCHGREIYCIETACRGRGDSTCFMVGHDRDAWGPDIEPHLAYYEKDCLSAALQELTAALARTETALRRSQRALREAEGQDAGDIDEAGRAGPAGLIARSAAMTRVLDVARRAAEVDATVLITGDTGVGKERLARFIHERSPRAARAMVAVNCGAVAETLLESELFGHVRGAFTGAQSDRIGLFEAAHQGTLLLDEIGELTPAMQVKLLRVLAEREVRRVGDTRARTVDVRVLCATHRDLAAEVEAGRFRRDLYYRLRVLELAIPPLRQRKDDILPLARLFAVRGARRMGKEYAGFTARAADQLLRHDWPGNIRELENAIERALIIAEGPRIRAADLPEDVRAAEPGHMSAVVRPLRDVERDHILAALAAHGGNRWKTAEALGIGRATLHRKLRQYHDQGWAEK